MLLLPLTCGASSGAGLWKGGRESPTELAPVVGSCVLVSYRGLTETGSGEAVSSSAGPSTSVMMVDFVETVRPP